jgi:hypothetical protein
MDKEIFKKWNKESCKWKEKKIGFIKSLENIPLIQRKNYFKKFKEFNREYENYFQLCNELFATEESIRYFYRKGDCVNAKEMEGELNDLFEMVGQAAEDFFLVQKNLEFITYKFDLANYMNKIGINFSKEFYFDISREGYKF